MRELITASFHDGGNGSLTICPLPAPADFLVNMSASADVLAMAKVEVDLSAIPEGKNVGLPRPIIRKRTSPPTDMRDTHPGHYQMARQARLHPSPNTRRDRGGQLRKDRVLARPAN